jgi:hypothetical protein
LVSPENVPQYNTAIIAQRLCSGKACLAGGKSDVSNGMKKLATLWRLDIMAALLREAK